MAKTDLAGGGPAIMIDTQVVIWTMLDPERIGKRALDLLQSYDRPVVVSHYSLVEMTIKMALGKLRLSHGQIEEALKTLDIAVVPAGWPELATYRVFTPDNKDPFDNLLMSVALAHGYALMTADDKILRASVGGLECLDARR